MTTKHRRKAKTRNLRVTRYALAKSKWVGVAAILLIEDESTVAVGLPSSVGGGTAMRQYTTAGGARRAYASLKSYAAIERWLYKAHGVR